MKSQVWKNPVIRIEKFPSFVIPRNATILQLIIHFRSIVCEVVEEDKNKRKFQTFSSKSGSGRLQ